MVCVNYNMENVECTWQRGAETPDNAQQHLFFWYTSYILITFIQNDTNSTKTLKTIPK